MPKPTVPLRVMKILATAYPVTLEVYADGEVKMSKSVTSASPFRIGGKYRATEYEYKITATSEIKRFTAAATMDEMKRIV